MIHPFWCYFGFRLLFRIAACYFFIHAFVCSWFVHSYYKHNSFLHVVAQVNRCLLPNLLKLLLHAKDMLEFAWWNFHLTWKVCRILWWSSCLHTYHIYIIFRCSILSCLCMCRGNFDQPEVLQSMRSASVQSQRSQRLSLSDWCAPRTAEEPLTKKRTGRMGMFWLFFLKSTHYCLKVCSFHFFHSLLQALIALGYCSVKHVICLYFEWFIGVFHFFSAEHFTVSLGGCPFVRRCGCLDTVTIMFGWCFAFKRFRRVRTWWTFCIPPAGKAVRKAGGCKLRMKIIWDDQML